MKKTLMIMVLGALVACLVPVSAQQQTQWQSTSALQTMSTYNPQLSPVGATSVTPMGTTISSSPANAPGRPRREDANGDGIDDDFQTPGDTNQSTETPVGEPWVLLVFAACGAAVIAARRRQRA